MKITVKDLKLFLNNCTWGDNTPVVVCDSDGAELRVVGLHETNGNSFGIDIDQECPDCWFDDRGNEIDWSYHDISRITTEEHSEVLVVDPDIFGDAGEHSVLLTIQDGIAFSDDVTMTYPKLDELTYDQLREIDAYIGKRILRSGCVRPYDVCVKYGKIVDFGIMDTGNGHNPELVRHINLLWAKKREAFKPILCALYRRDAEEILHSDAFSMEEGRDVEYVKSYMEDSWDVEATNYLMHIADDTDLECIIKYIKL